MTTPKFVVPLVLMASAGALFAQTPQQQAWDMLRAGVNQKSTGKRTQAVRALQLLPGDPEALGMAQTALQDRKPEVRVAAATGLGLMGCKAAIPGLKRALFDRKPAVVLAAAHALQLLNDPAGYQVYFEVLTGERKSAEGLVAQHMETLRDGKKMAVLGLEEGIEFIPFADIGFSAAKAMRKDNASPVRATAARTLFNDMDPRISQALVRAVSDKSWIVRASAVLANAKREDPDLLNAIVPALSDKNKVLRFTAAAAVIRLTAVAARNKNVTGTSNVLGGESRSRQTPTATPSNPL
ncbi:MAG TPA: HEAT repeat domain-containing protein [Candidatus Acidoferrales bacterium]|nr:HEAT repeat domain-containing protein [Candidatus Acidoferrales bacterium]